MRITEVRNDGTVIGVELSDADAVVAEWHESLLAKGMAVAEACHQIRASTPRHGAAWTVLADKRFTDWLVDRSIFILTVNPGSPEPLL